MTLFERLRKSALYAQKSFSTELLYEVKGNAEMAYELGGITWDECRELHEMTVRFMNTDRSYIAYLNKEFFENARFASPGR